MTRLLLEFEETKKLYYLGSAIKSDEDSLVWNRSFSIWSYSSSFPSLCSPIHRLKYPVFVFLKKIILIAVRAYNSYLKKLKTTQQNYNTKHELNQNIK